MTATDDALRQAPVGCSQGRHPPRRRSPYGPEPGCRGGSVPGQCLPLPVLVEFRQCVANQEAHTPGTSSPHEENRGFRAELKELRSRHAAEAARLRADADGLLQLVQVLTVERRPCAASSRKVAL